jgi:hypothetical protein
MKRPIIDPPWAGQPSGEVGMTLEVANGHAESARLDRFIDARSNPAACFIINRHRRQEGIPNT